MEIVLTPRFEEFIEEKVKSGLYVDGGEVIRGYLRNEIGNVGAGEGDIEALAFIVMMQATQDMNSDLKEIMGKVKAQNSARQKLRGLRRKIAADVAANSPFKASRALTFGSDGMGSESAYHRVKLPVIDPVSASGVRYIEKDLHDGTIKTVRELTAIVERMDDQLDTLGEMQEAISLKLQMLMDRMSKMMTTLSNIFKKMSDTAGDITDNLK